MRAPPYLPTILTGLVLAVLTALPARSQRPPANENRSTFDSTIPAIVATEGEREEEEPQNGIGQWRVGGFTNRLGNYEIHGDRQGRVTVRDLASGEIVRTFQMPEERVIRTTWLLDGGRVAAASQLHQTLFWDMETGEEIDRLDYQVYAFSHNLEKLIAFDYRDGFFVYDYPNLRQTCSVPYARSGGPSWMQFSPDNDHLLISIWTSRPAFDEYYPFGNPGSALKGERLFELNTCQFVREFSDLRLLSAQRMCFARNSSYLYIEGAISLPITERTKRNLLFDLNTREIEEVTSSPDFCN